MMFRTLDAMSILIERLGPTVNKVRSGERPGLEGMKVLGFQTASLKAIALDIDPHQIAPARLSIEPPAPPPIKGIRPLSPKTSSNLDIPALSALNDHRGIRLEIENKAALDALLDWCA